MWIGNSGYGGVDMKGQIWRSGYGVPGVTPQVFKPKVSQYILSLRLEG